MTAVRRALLVDQVIEHMRQRITAGAWPVGHRIPTEPVLADELQVARNTVREAVRALSHSGLLQVRQGSGTYVRATSELSGALRRLRTAELRDVLQVRRGLEVEAARLAADVRDEDGLRALEARLAECEAVARAGRWERLAQLDTAFHMALVEFTGNSVLAGLYRGFYEAVLASVLTCVDPCGAEPGLAFHRRLLEAVRAGDAERAAAEAGAHLSALLRQRNAVPAAAG
ncbi:FadR/GntR family transcriptional regulator [Streptomyces sp. SKN60]|uniref:FadR/GntR family transcriptional regulator n=1 Tax=Streptomyces sp. SKN60 TaxID=2855506 RepID=UPI00224873A6|nr:FCD domain-containing protein [Streptomyces sp. SKN60]